MKNKYEIQDELDREMRVGFDRWRNRVVPAIVEDAKETIQLVEYGFDRTLRRHVAGYFEGYKDVYYETIDEDLRFNRQRINRYENQKNTTMDMAYFFI